MQGQERGEGRLRAALDGRRSIRHRCGASGSASLRQVPANRPAGRSYTGLPRVARSLARGSGVMSWRSRARANCTGRQVGMPRFARRSGRAGSDRTPDASWCHLRRRLHGDHRRLASARSSISISASSASEAAIAGGGDPDRARPVQYGLDPHRAATGGRSTSSPTCRAASADLARQVAEIGRRLAAMEGKVETALDRTRGGDRSARPGDRRARHAGQAARRDGRRPSDGARRARHAPAPARVLAAEALAQPLRRRAVATPPAPQARHRSPSAERRRPRRRHAGPREPAEARTRQADALASIRAAIDANRIDLYLQPIVTLPQRKVRYYEAMSRLRTESGDVLHGGRLHPAAPRAAA